MAKTKSRSKRGKAALTLASLQTGTRAQHARLPPTTAVPDRKVNAIVRRERSSCKTSRSVANFPTAVENVKLNLRDSNGVKLEDANTGRILGYYYAVTKGWRPGIYNDWDETMMQLRNFQGNECYQASNLAGAIGCLREQGFTDDDIRVHRRTFIPRPDFLPDPTASFKDEIDRLCSSQRWNKEEQRKARTDGIRDEIIRYFLPNGVRIHSDWVDEDDEIDLDDDETLQIYKKMCHVAGKSVHESIDKCLVELKKRPFVNILDFIDTYRTGKPIHTFSGWAEFTKYTRQGRKIDLRMAKKNEFLAPLLQDLVKGPNATDPRHLRRRLVAKRKAKLRRREAQHLESIPIKVEEELPRCLSPSVSDLSSNPSRPGSPIWLPDTRNQTEAALQTGQIKSEPPSSLASHFHKENNSSEVLLLSSTPPSEISDSDLIELSMKLEAATQNPGCSQPDLDISDAFSDISDSDLIELSLKLESASQVPGSD